MTYYWSFYATCIENRVYHFSCTVKKNKLPSFRTLVTINVHCKDLFVYKRAWVVFNM